MVTTAAQDIGIIGIGLMGRGIATNLQGHGHRLHLLDHPGNQPLTSLVDNGALSYSSAAQVAGAARTVIICVTGTPEVEDVLRRDDGILAGMQAGSVIIDCSTCLPDSTRHNAARVDARGGEWLDAPMTRTPKEAMQGRLNLIVGGKQDVYARCKPLLECFAENITYAGGIGSGHSLKLLHNYVSLGFATILSEAAACASTAGVNESVFIDVLAKGGGAGVILERMAPYILDQDDSGFRFSIANAAKDLGYYQQMSDQLQAENQVADAVHRLLEHALNSMEGEPDSALPRLIDHLQKRGDD